MDNDEEKLAKKLEIKNAINMFYKLKDEYETEIHDIKRKIAKKTHLSTKEKREEFKKSKPKCINCKRPVGTIFETKYNKDTETRIAKSMCGDKVDKCPLNIEINFGSIKNVAQEVNDYHKQIVDVKEQIIIIKNNILFGYTTPDESVAKFSELKETLDDLTESYESLLVSYNAIYEFSNKKQYLIDTERKIYDYIKQMKDMIVDYNKELNLQYITDAVEIYVTSLMPILEEYRDTRYPVCYVDIIDKKCKLIQRRVDPDDTEIDLGLEPIGVTSFVIGDSTPSKKTPKKKEDNNEEVVLNEIEELSDDFYNIGD